jgi:hypothetical protein
VVVLAGSVPQPDNNKPNEQIALRTIAFIPIPLN